MSYVVEHVRATLTCDACGKTETRESDVDGPHLTRSWGSVSCFSTSHFCCPECLKLVWEILNRKAAADEHERREKIRTCVHEFQQRGFLRFCLKCGFSGG